MKERPILFSAPMVLALLEERKTNTRRVAKLNAGGRVQLGGKQWHIEDPEAILACPYGQVGDRLWVKETHILCSDYAIYRADVDPVAFAYTTFLAGGWKPSIFMFRKHSRITLELTDVRVQRLQEITEADALAEGIQRHILPDIRGARFHWGDSTEDRCFTAVDAFHALWDSINAKRGFGWNTNPWVWALTFQRVDGGAL